MWVAGAVLYFAVIFLANTALAVEMGSLVDHDAKLLSDTLAGYDILGTINARLKTSTLVVGSAGR